MLREENGGGFRADRAVAAASLSAQAQHRERVIYPSLHRVVGCHGDAETFAQQEMCDLYTFFFYLKLHITQTANCTFELFTLCQKGNNSIALL